VKRIILLIALTTLLPSVLYGDWKIVSRTGDSTMTEFFKGELIRTDSSPAYTTVMDFNHRQQVAWRSDLRQYVVVQWLPALQNDLPPASVITIERNTTDTGQRKQFFGRTARRLVTRVTRSDGPETTIDGWYIDAPGLPKRKSGAGAALAILTTSAGGQKLGPPKIELKQTGPLAEGLAVWQKTTSSIVLPGGSRQDSEHVTEVSDLMEGTLPDKLFQPPDGYQRVASLPGTASNPVPHTWGGLLQAHWYMMKDWFSTLF
jgi:hypothetical protein